MEKEKISILVEKYSNMVMRIAYQNCFNKSDSEDIVQEVFIRLLKNIHKLEEDYIKAWIIRVTINICKDYNKNFWYKKTEPLDNIEIEYFDKDEIEVFKVISKLKPIYRNIIYLYYYEGYKINEIAKILNLNENTVSSNLSRARKKLKGILEEGEELYE